MSWRFVSLIFGYFMVTLVLSGALAFSLTDFMEDSLFGSRRLIFIVVLFAYGLYRSIRVFQLHKQIKSELNN